MSGIMKPEWPGAASKWHIQAHNRNDAGPSGPPHWPKRPFDVGGFCASVHDLPPRGQRHFDAPPSGIVRSHHCVGGARTRENVPGEAAARGAALKMVACRRGFRLIVCVRS
jgi:hypothetical protein